jgi:hypothetical protein
MRLLVLILCSLCMLSCQAQKPVERRLSQDEYDVYNTIIAEMLNVYDRTPPLFRNSPRKIFVFHQTVRGGILAGSDSNSNFSRYISRRQWSTMVFDFSKISNDTLQLDSNKLTFPSELIFDRHSPKSGQFVYSFGLQMFSRVGFDSARSNAVVYDHVYAEWSGDKMYLLAKANDRWIVTDCLFSSFERIYLRSTFRPYKPEVGVRISVPDAVVIAEDSTTQPK